MFTIHGKGNKSVWSAKNNRVLGKFKDGILQTDDGAVAAEFAKLGYVVDGEPKAKAKENPKAQEEPKAQAAPEGV